MTQQKEDKIVFSIRVNRVVNICTLIGMFSTASYFGINKANKILNAISDSQRDNIELKARVTTLESEVQSHHDILLTIKR